MRMRLALRKKSFVLLLLTVAATTGVLLIGSAGSASANGSVTYTQQESQPIPPAQHYAGSTGGDGYAIALYNGRVYNVFHHQANLRVDCHVQSTAAACWSTGPEVISDNSGTQFRTPGEAGMYLDPATGKLWVYAARASDLTAGVVCIDTTIADTNPNPFCGFVPLTAAGDSTTGSNGRTQLSTPMLVGTHLYSFNYYPGAGATGGRNKVLCFDVTTDTACAGEPYSTTLGPGTVAAGNATADSAIGTELIIPINVGGVSELACFDTTSLATCTGSWPVATPSAPTASYGAPYPLLNLDGSANGFCLPNGTDPCFNLNGSSTATPSGMAAAIPDNFSTNSEFSLGPRVYVPSNTTNTVYCWDYSTSSTCTNFPLALSNLTGLYTVNPDPQRPTCLWVNSDHGTWQIQNFDAYTGGPCTQTRVLASQFVVSGAPQCFPTSYTSLQILSPTPDQYQGGSISFADGAGNPIPGLPAVPLDSTGTANLAGLTLNTPTGLPQFLITLNNAPVNPAPLNVKLTWVGPYDPVCVTGGQGVSASTSLDANLNDGTTTAKSLTEWVGTPVTNQGILSGTNAANATGTVTYHWWTDNSCTIAAAADDTESITTPPGSAGTLPVSQPVNLPAGTYYETVDYSGDAINSASSTACGLETLVVNQIPTKIVYTGDTDVYAGDTAHISFVLYNAITNTVLANQTVTISLPTALGGGLIGGTTDANGSFSTTVTAPLVNSDTTYSPAEIFFGSGGKYLGSTGTGKLTVHVIPTNITYNGTTSVLAGQPANLSFVLKDNHGNVLANQPVVIQIPAAFGGGTASGNTDGNGVFSTTVTAPFPASDTTYAPTESYARQGKYLASSGTGQITVHVIPTYITYTGSTEVYAGQPATISFVLYNQNTSTPLPNEPVTITLPDGSLYTGTTDANGVVSTTVTAPMTTGTYTPSESFTGDEPYLASTGPGTLQVDPIPTAINYIGDTSVYSGQPATLTFVLTNQISGALLPNEPVTISFNGTNYSATTDGSGIASIVVTSPIVSTNTTYTPTESFGGQDPYLASSGPGSLLVQPIPTSVTYTGDTSINAGSTANVSFVLKNAITNTVLANEPVTITLPGGGTVSGTTNASGVFSTTTAALSAGTYTVSEAFAGQAQYLASSGPGTIVVAAVNTGPFATGNSSIGFWKNQGQSIIKSSAAVSGVCKVGTWLRNYKPFQDLSATANCTAVASYVQTVLTNAKASDMNSMLKAQMLGVALDDYFSTGSLGGNPIGASWSFGSNTYNLTNVPGDGSAASAFGGATSMSTGALLTYASNQSNIGGSTWYANSKSVQGLAKDVFADITTGTLSLQ